jgi:L-ascorbate metabolism protein UlaG (beta-lactamase superfamily)
MASTKITFIGHSTLLLEVNGVKLLTDPIFGKYPRYIFFFRREWNAGKTIKEVLAEKIDAILLSHNHLDHYHVPSLREFPRALPFFVPLGYKSYVQSAYRHFTNIHELEVWQSEEFKGITITLVPAYHTRKGKGYVIEGEHTLYFPGDTGYFQDINEFPNRFSHFDVIFLPMMQHVPEFWRDLLPHIDPHDGVKIVKILNPRKYAIPIHFGFYPTLGNPLKIPDQFKELLEKEGLGHLYHLLRNGETLEL